MKRRMFGLVAAAAPLSVSVWLGQPARAVEPGRLVAPPRAGTAEAENERQALALLGPEAALKQKVTLAYRGDSLGSVLAGLRKQLGAPLTASRDTADEKVVLFVKDRPAVEVLTALARHFDFQWYRSGGSLELGQNTGARQREQALRDADRVSHITAAGRRMQQIARLADLPAERVESRKTELNRILADANTGTAERRAARDEVAAFSDLARPGGRVASRLYQSLNALQLQQLQAGAELRFASDNGTLPPALADMIHEASRQRGDSRQVLALGRPVEGPEEEAPPTHATALVRVTDNAGMMRMAARRGQPTQQLRLEFVFSSFRGGEGRQLVIPLNWSPNVESGFREARKTETKDPALLAQTTLKIEPAAKAEAAPVVLTLGRTRPGMVTLGEVLEALHRATGLELLSDSYIRARVLPAQVNGKGKVVEFLDALANEVSCDWEKQGDLVRLRSRTHFLDRPAEVPGRVLKPWSERVARAGAATLDDLSELAAGLNDFQTRSLTEFWNWYFEGTDVSAPQTPGGVHAARHHLRFWASLSRAQRQLVQGGGILGVDKLGPRQREAFMTALLAPSEGPIAGGNLARTPTPQEIATGGFSLRQNELTQNTYAGTGPNGERTALVLLNGNDGPGGQAAPMPPNVPGLTLEPVGPPTKLDGYSFSYHLAGNQAPVRTVNLNLPRAAVRNK